MRKEFYKEYERVNVTKARTAFKKNKTVTVVGTYGSWSKISSGQWLPSSRLKRK